MSNLDIKERARRRLQLLQSYAVLNQANVSYYVRQAQGLSAAEVAEKLKDLEGRMQLVAIEHAVMTDMFQNTSMYDRTKEEMQERVRGVLAHLRDEERAKEAKPVEEGAARRALIAALKEEPDAAKV